MCLPAERRVPSICGRTGREPAMGRPHVGWRDVELHALLSCRGPEAERGRRPEPSSGSAGPAVAAGEDSPVYSEGEDELFGSDSEEETVIKSQKIGYSLIIFIF